MEIKLIDKNTARVKLSRKRDKELVDFLKEHKELYLLESTSTNRYLYLLFRFKEKIENLDHVVSFMNSLHDLSISEILFNRLKYTKGDY